MVSEGSCTGVGIASWSMSKGEQYSGIKVQRKAGICSTPGSKGRGIRIRGTLTINMVGYEIFMVLIGTLSVILVV